MSLLSAEGRSRTRLESHCLQKFNPRRLLLAGLLLILATAPACGQGCSQCLDSTRATPPAVQASYRHAIYLLGGAGAIVFLVGLILFRREP